MDNRITLHIIATKKYKLFLQNLISSADKYFFPNYAGVDYILYLDDVNFQISTWRDYSKVKIEHKEWPFMTLSRYSFFLRVKDQVEAYSTHSFYCDVDMLFINDISEEILGERVSTIHPGFLGGRGTPETDIRSLACVKHDEPMVYYAGGFQGGTTHEFYRMCETINNNILKDLENNIIALWHDESHYNRYMIDNKPTIVLSPSYCYPESYSLPYPKKLLALDKDHKWFREE